MLASHRHKNLLILHGMFGLYAPIVLVLFPAPGHGDIILFGTWTVLHGFLLATLYWPFRRRFPGICAVLAAVCAMVFVPATLPIVNAIFSINAAILAAYIFTAIYLFRADVGLLRGALVVFVGVMVVGPTLAVSYTRWQNRLRYHLTETCAREQLAELRGLYPRGTRMSLIQKQETNTRIFRDGGPEMLIIPRAGACPKSGRPYCGFHATLWRKRLVRIEDGAPCH